MHDIISSDSQDLISRVMKRRRKLVLPELLTDILFQASIGQGRQDFPLKLLQLDYQDHLYLDMTAEKMQEMGFFGRGNTNYNVVTVLDESVDQQMVERIRKTLSDLHYSGTWGVSLLPEGGFTFRVLSEDGPKNYSLMAALIRTFRETEKGLPPLRSSKAERSRMRPYNSIECAGNRADTRLFVQDSKI